MTKIGQDFGGAWTQQKLDCLEKYLKAYTTIFHANPRAAYFETTYLDAFAGTGYMHAPDLPLLRDMPEYLAGVEEYQKGSVIRALEVQPGFDRYIFIEKDLSRFAELETIKAEFPEKEIRLRNEDANSFLKNWCRESDWEKSRAVVFLDPFGTNVSWSVVQAIASTGGIDLWILFPIFAVNRMLVRGEKPPLSWAKRLDEIFGTKAWADEFYTAKPSTLFEGIGLDVPASIEKVADYEKIGSYFVDRLKSIFVAVAEPLVLRNSRNSPLYLFCFAAGNNKGATTGLKIAKDIIGK